MVGEGLAVADGQEGFDLSLDPSWETGGARRAVARLLRHRLIAQALASAVLLAVVLVLRNSPGPGPRLVLDAIRYGLTVDYDFAAAGSRFAQYVQRFAGDGGGSIPAAAPAAAPESVPGEAGPPAVPGRAPARDEFLPGGLPGSPPEASEPPDDGLTGVTASPPVMSPPLEGHVLSWFGWRIGSDGAPEYHRGLDIAAPTGTPVRAAAAGVVRKAAEDAEYGKYLIIDHGGGWETLYAHNSRLAVREGTVVRRGQVIAYVGRTGNATTPHLHFEVRANGREKDPAGHIGLAGGEGGQGRLP